MHKFALIVNFKKKRSIELTKFITNFLISKGKKVYISKSASNEIQGVHFEDEDFLFNCVDCIIVLGGDGTILEVARKIGPKETPILGINLGKLGFLAEVEEKDINNALEKLIGNEFEIEKRMMLKANVKIDGQERKFIAFNDIVIKGSGIRMMNFNTFANGSFVENYRADGLIISTPTGSTAYSLSAGGPIVSPDTNLIIINPICPHTLHNRTFIVSDTVEVEVKVNCKNPFVLLIIDGQQCHNISPSESMFIKKASFYTNLIKLNEQSFYDILRKKLSKTIVK